MRSRALLFLLASTFVVLCVIMFFQKKTHKIDKNALSLLKRNHEIIHESAKSSNIPVLAIAGVIAAELTLNHNFLDSSQDILLSTWLEIYNEEWWGKWASKGKELAEEAELARLKSNKWPTPLVEMGYVVSFGPAQITPRTILMACQEHNMKPLPCCGSTKQIIGRVLTEKTSIQMVAVILDYEANKWESNSNYDVRADLGLLATLYSMGGEYYRHQFATNNQIIQYNKLGKWVVEHKDEIAKIIASQ